MFHTLYSVGSLTVQDNLQAIKINRRISTDFSCTQLYSNWITELIVKQREKKNHSTNLMPLESPIIHAHRGSNKICP